MASKTGQNLFAFAWAQNRNERMWVAGKLMIGLLAT